MRLNSARRHAPDQVTRDGRPARRAAEPRPEPQLLARPVRQVPGKSRRVFAGQSDGVRWAIRTGLDAAGRLSTVVLRAYRGAAATSSVPGSSPRDGQLISMWIGRAPGIPPFLLLRTTAEVTHATAILASGDRRDVALSPLMEDFGLRFGAAPAPGRGSAGGH
jgi:hypothetical protein